MDNGAGIIVLMNKDSEEAANLNKFYNITAVLGYEHRGKRISNPKLLLQSLVDGNSTHRSFYSWYLFD